MGNISRILANNDEDNNLKKSRAFFRSPQYFHSDENYLVQYITAPDADNEVDKFFIDHAIQYVAFPDDGVCEDVEGEIIRPVMDYVEGDSFFIVGASPQIVEQFLLEVETRCNELNATCESEAEAYGIDFLLFYPKDIFLVLAENEIERIAGRINSMDQFDDFRMGMACFTDPETNRTIIPILL